MKKGSGKAKGGAFERLICKKLSLWWTDGKRDDVFYRTASSGGRATQRTKRGAKTFGQYGDIQAADPIGQPLLDLCVIECKDGYAHDSIADLLDKEPRHRPNYLLFMIQAMKERKEASRRLWLLIARRRGRQIMVYAPYVTWKKITGWPLLSFIQGTTNVPYGIISIDDFPTVFCLPLENFFRVLTPKEIRDLQAE